MAVAWKQRHGCRSLVSDSSLQFWGVKWGGKKNLKPNPRADS